MKVLTGRVVDGKVVVDGESLLEGTQVIVIAEGGDVEEETFQLTPEEKAELLERIKEARDGPWIGAWDLLRDLGHKT